MFFQALTEQIEKQSGEPRKKLEDLRAKLLDLTRVIDARMDAEVKAANELLATIVNSDDIPQSTAEHLPEMGEIFIQVLNQALQEANQKNDVVRMPKLQQVVKVIQEASSPPPELKLLEEFLGAADEADLDKRIEAHAEDMTPEFINVIASLISRNETGKGKNPTSEEAQMSQKLEQVHRSVLRFSMKKNIAR